MRSGAFHADDSGDFSRTHSGSLDSSNLNGSGASLHQLGGAGGEDLAACGNCVGGAGAGGRSIRPNRSPNATGVASALVELPAALAGESPQVGSSAKPKLMMSAEAGRGHTGSPESELSLGEPLREGGLHGEDPLREGQYAPSPFASEPPTMLFSSDLGAGAGFRVIGSGASGGGSGEGGGAANGIGADDDDSATTQTAWTWAGA